ncbi:MAG: hypothetical protein ACYC3N_05115 [Halothiobacillus sp.]
MQISKHVFRASALGMVSMGFGIPKSTALTPTFITATLIAGLVVGGLNFALASRHYR